jgi:hypothetical protein
MLEFVTQHQFWAAVVVYWIFSAAVSSMPEPASGGNAGYLWLFRFLHTTAGNITTAFGSRIPGIVKPLVWLLVIPLALSTPACAAAHYTTHPGALNKTDSESYDALLVAEKIIDEARADYQAGRLPAEAKVAFNALIRSYNLARQGWLTYRGAIATNVPADAYYNQLNKNLTDLTDAIRVFLEAK